ncbi:MAG: SPFH domain-containing protein [bacterium]|nr:SPFH domain-containing protein [bacterium]
MTFVFTVKEKEAVIMQSFGKYTQTITTPGITVVPPWHNIAARVDLSLRQVEETLSTKTKDDIFVSIPIKIHTQVTDAKRYHYDSNKPEEQVKVRVAATIKQLVSGMDFIELYQTREHISELARQKVGKEIEDLYGMKLVDVIVDEPHANQTAMNSFSSVKEAERNMLAAQNDSAAIKMRIIAEAEARKEALRLHGEGIAEQRAAIFANYAEQFNNLAKKGMSPEMAHEVITLAMALDTTRDAAEKGNMILSTTNAGDLIAQMQTLGKTLTKGHIVPSQNDNLATPAIKPPKVG